MTHFLLIPAGRPSLDGRMRAIMESGLRVEWYNEGVKDWHHCRHMQRSGASEAGVLSYEELSYDDMAAIFVLWGIMTMLSLAVFLAELGFHATATKRRCHQAFDARQRTIRHQGQVVNVPINVPNTVQCLPRNVPDDAAIDVHLKRWLFSKPS
ncbi:hypothetical protein HPB50_026236 [Hyalomma asiaticum]|uniref:Uncharacterized protein n=1 Tax=Hyalomma asiaticum TaxID=266040 RepID=A0ACB7SRA8_HYAAI|nr:hypothetical protein HPB50_026236 [Hyalomma asiaticum]